jgi:hypothetical protein
MREMKGRLLPRIRTVYRVHPASNEPIRSETRAKNYWTMVLGSRHQSVRGFEKLCRAVSLEIPDPGSGQARIKVQAFGVCNSDAHLTALVE